MEIQVSQISETSVIAYIGDEISPELVDKLSLFTQRVHAQFPLQVTDVISSYTSVLIEFHPLKLAVRELLEWCETELVNLDRDTSQNGLKNVVELPVYYHPEVAPDLEALAFAKGLSVEDVINIHRQAEYTVYAIGFAPGFAFLGSVDERISAPRHKEPRLKVAKGSVGIADSQTAVYPLETPGGWNIIGNCPLALFDVNSDPMMPFNVGDRIQFSAISREQFLDLGGII
ncbi:5-oxoprolinase subunit PxpB [Vibrio sp. RC27]